MMNKYFRKKFKTEKSVKRAIKTKTFYDYCKINLRGDTILSQKYGYQKTIDWLNKSHYYTIISLVSTRDMINDINDFAQKDINKLIKDKLHEGNS